ncbi:ras guanyl-nucleotide exchange factor [Ophiostoma piceae UAMH 11346]|uniref:Ras guanyl-nucleotide exchange factor n=1 Tax=Ophiostoma piceae (strain UAMH 11346) TaxID=1262450 RepID=S3BPN1_OPHP1|nr:ras guanyl-nucleotide exchange factor [Ophiostoma piceae UAMH 11346]
MATPTKLRSMYRAFLRELHPRHLLTTQRSPLHAQLRSEFEPSSENAVKNASSSTSVFHGEQYLTYLQAQRTYSTLLERYNPNLSGNLDEKERIRLTARRVGMNLPVDYESDDVKASEGSGRK